MAVTPSPSHDPLDAFQALEADLTATPEYDAWLRAEIAKTLEAKAEGRMTYRPPEGVARRFLPDAH